MISRGEHRISASCLSSVSRGIFSTTALVLHVFFLLVLLSPQDTMGTEYVVGVAGSRTELPCHLLTEQMQDRAILALWYIQGRRLPVYSYDARGLNGLYQPDEVLAGRGSFDTSSSPARLILNPVRAKDQGVYTCRVDFLLTPTHNTVVNLTVIEPPEKLAIYNDAGTIVRNTIGPINEGSPLTLACIVIGGRPQPTVSWWSEQTLVERKSEVTREGNIRSELKIPEVSRAYHKRTFSCQAQNNNQQKPLVQKVSIDMNLRPLSVRIKIPENPLIAGKQYTFTCESKGSKPRAEIAWFQDANKVDAMRTHTRSGVGEVTIGEVTLVPNQVDHGKTLKCQASNPSMPASAISDAVTLNVEYSPMVVLQMGRNLVPGAIKQGDDVYFECRVTANPSPYKVTWDKNSEQVTSNMTAGVILSGDSLVLQKVDRSSAGEYTCSAANSHGIQLSNPVRLDIMYSPECMVDQPTVLAVGRGERVNISCRVASNPPRATFNWRLNGSDKTYTSQGELLPSGHLASHFTFLGATDKDYGALFCWANNSIGIQEKPCVFQIIPAGPPSSPEHCEIINNTAENIEVMCEHGFDGGMQQMFLAEVYDEGGSLHLNRSSKEPQFSVESLQPGTTYTIRVSAFNAKGRSQPVSLTAVTLKVAEQRVGENKSLLYSPLIIIFVSIVSVFVVFILLLVFVTKWIKNNSANVGASNSSSSGGGGVGGGGGGGSHNTQSSLEPLRSDAGEEHRPTMEETELVKPKPKKKVVVVENGKDRVGLPPLPDTSSTDITSSSKDALLGRHTESQPLANGSAGYYNSLGKTSFPSTYQSSSSSSTSSTLPRSHRTNSSTVTFSHHGLSPPHNKIHFQNDDYLPCNTRYSETLPRNLGRGSGGGGGGGVRDNIDTYRGGGILRSSGVSDGYRSAGEGVEGCITGSDTYRNMSHLSSESYRGGEVGLRGDPYLGGGGTLSDSYRGSGNGANVGQDTYQGGGGGGVGGDNSMDSYHDRSALVGGDTYRSAGGGDPSGGVVRSGKDKYHLLEELKNNPKYVVRTRACDPNDESFV